MSEQMIAWNKEDAGFEALLRIASEDEVRKIIKRAFPNCDRLWVWPAESYGGEIPRVKLSEKNNQPTATVEFFREGRAERPLANYAKHAAGLLGPQKLRSVRGGQVTAIIYSPGVPLSQKLISLFEEDDLTTAGQVLARVLERLVPWDLGKKRLEMIAPYHSWLRGLGNVDDARGRWIEICRDLENGLIKSASHVAGLFNHAIAWRQKTYSTLIHGDLNADNVLINPNDQIVFIDFANTGKGHFLWDLARLESDLTLRVIPQAFDPARAGASSADWQPKALEFANQIQCFIRKAAWSRMEKRAEFIPEYYLGLFCNSIRAVFHPRPGSFRTERRLAAFNCARIARKFEFHEHGMRYCGIPGNHEIEAFISPPFFFGIDGGRDRDESDARKCAAQMADVAVKLQGEGNVHSDLKPRNILVTEDSQVKVLDFGSVSFAEASAGKPGSVVSSGVFTDGQTRIEELLGQAVDDLTVALETLKTGDPIAADIHALNASEALSRVYRYRSSGEGFGLLASSLRNAISLSRADPLTREQLETLVAILKDLRDNPKIGFSQASAQVSSMRKMGLQVQPASFHHLAEWLDGQSVR
jgi:Ser/Thr protein kinase RdoA (MazF antagonist)